jgi:hypothetical protein
MNHQCRCSLPSPQRQTWTRPISPTLRTGLDAQDQRPELERALSRQAAQVVVLARLEENDDSASAADAARA